MAGKYMIFWRNFNNFAGRWLQIWSQNVKIQNGGLFENYVFRKDKYHRKLYANKFQLESSKKLCMKRKKNPLWIFKTNELNE